MLDAVYSPHWLTADSSLLAGQHHGYADVNDNEVTSSGRCLLLLLSRHHPHYHHPHCKLWTRCLTVISTSQTVADAFL